MKANLFPLWWLPALALAASPEVQSAPVREPAWQEGLRTLAAALKPVQTNAPPRAAEPMRKGVAPDGTLRYLGSPPGLHLESPAPLRGQSTASALRFVEQHGRFFGVTSKAVDFRQHRLKQSGGRSYVHLRQTYAGVPFFASDLMVQVSEADGVEAVLAHIERDTRTLDEGRLALAPTLDEAAARKRLELEAQAQADGAPFTIESLTLTLFAPSLFEVPGSPHLVWLALVKCPDRVKLNEKILLDAHSGEVLLRLPRYRTMERRIYDANNHVIFFPIATPARSEGEGPVTEGEVNRAYDYLGNVFDFYWGTHGRSGFDNHNMWMYAAVRVCWDTLNECPWEGAIRSSDNRLYFGEGWTADDVVAHEFTHGVTDFESGLEYWNQSGAINESFSDMWGEFVDLTNGSGSDTDYDRWLVGEDITKWGTTAPQTVRDMRNPPHFGHPDRLSSTNYVPAASSPSDDNDHGGVHHNSGVGNKLCYLLADGDTFNGQTVFGMGILRVACLFYEANVNLMGASSGWADLSHAAHQAAVNLGWTLAERENLYRALLAVEIEDTRNLYVDKWSSCTVQDGSRDCIVNPFAGEYHGPYRTVGEGVYHTFWGDVLHIRTGTYPESVRIDKRTQLRSYDGETTIGR